MTPEQIAEGQCSAYIKGHMICRNGFPIKNTCWTGSRWDNETSRPHCMNEDYCPPHLIDSDTGFPILAVSAELERIADE